MRERTLIRSSRALARRLGEELRHATVATRSGAAPAQGARETKFSMQRPALTRALLKMYFTPDPLYPQAHIFNVYFDSELLDSYQEKMHGAQLKSKVRIRWYSHSPHLALPASVFLECKRKDGTVVGKDRMQVMSMIRPGDTPLNAAFWSALAGRAQLQELGVRAPQGLRPVMISSFRRIRYRDGASASRIALDEQITGHAFFAHPAPGCARRVTLPDAVLEIKNASGELPLALQSFCRHRRQSFSKYGALLARYVGDES